MCVPPPWKPPMRTLPNWIAATLLPLIGERCAGCEERPAPGGLCDGCRRDIPPLPDPHCPLCALPGATASVCGNCITAPPHFDAVVAAGSFSHPLDAYIRAFKYHSRLSLARPLASLLAGRLGAEALPDIIVPMPLSADRQRTRGFNQALELARQLPPPYPARIRTSLRRVRDTSPQAGLGASDRKENVKGAFSAGPEVCGRRVALIDDVMTSGATLDAAARSLKEAGAIEVRAWVVARALRHD
jgi:ComF family protein